MSKHLHDWIIVWRPCRCVHCKCARCTGLDGCRELRQLHITDCGMTNELGLVACQALRQVTELRLREQMADEPIISFVAEAMPQLVILDISYGRLGCAITCVAAGSSALRPLL